jgi:hypothetical protein
MATTNTPTTIASRLKEVYADGPSVIVPSCNELVGKRLEFKADLANGADTAFDIQLSGEQGFTTGQGEVTLLGAVAQTSAKATVQGWSVILQSNVSYDAITRAKTSKQAFVNFQNKKYIPSAESFRTRQELLAMGYGRQGLAVVTSNASGVLTITPGSWCSAMLLTMVGAKLEVFTAITGGSQHDTGDLVLSSVSTTNKTITLTGTTASIVAGDIVFLKGHRGNTMYGILDLAKNTSGSIYGISAASFDLWAGNQYDVGTSALSLGKISLASALAADKGCNEKLTCFVPNKAFQSLVNDQSALREYGANYSGKKAENGFESILFHGATGQIEILPYMFMKEGEFVLFCEKYTYLIGSEEMTNVIGNGGDIFFDLEAVGTKQMRWFADFTVMSDRPGYFIFGNRSDGLALHT